MKEKTPCNATPAMKTKVNQTKPHLSSILSPQAENPLPFAPRVSPCFLFLPWTVLALSPTFARHNLNLSLPIAAALYSAHPAVPSERAFARRTRGDAVIGHSKFGAM